MQQLDEKQAQIKQHLSTLGEKEAQLKNMQSEFTDKAEHLNKMESILQNSKLLSEDLESLRAEKQSRDEQ